MSPSFNYSSDDAHGDEDLELHHQHLTASDLHLSPFHHSHTLSNSASPSYYVDSTPAESLSEYSNYQPSELEISDVEDPFLGVNFDARVPRVDSIPTTAIFGNVAYQSANTDLNQPLPSLPRENKTTITSSTRPLSSVHSSKRSTPSPRRVLDELPSTVSPQELSLGSHNTQFPSFNPVTPTHPTTVQLTPDHSGSSQRSIASIEATKMPRYEQSPLLTTSQWDYPSQTLSDQQHTQQMPNNNAIFGGEFSGRAAEHSAKAGITRSENGLWTSTNVTGLAGLDPEARKGLDGAELPTLKEEEERRRIEAKNSDVNDWRSQTGGSEAEVEGPGYSSFPANDLNWSQQSQRNRSTQDNGIAPVDDNLSIHENRLMDGQVYFDADAAHMNDSDINLMKQPRHWSDAPAIPYIIEDRFQPETAQEAIQKFNRRADSISIASRAATWGTRRRSEPSLKDFEGVTDGSFLKKLSIKSSNNRPRQGSLLDGFASIYRKRSDSRLKRTRSTQNIPEASENLSHPRQGSQGSLAPPPRTSSFGRRQPSTPNINTASAFAAMAGQLAAVGATHARSGSVSASNTSPKSPSHLGLGSVFNRSRSKSDVSGQGREAGTALVGLWRGQGGPPVAKLAGQKSHHESKKQETQVQDDAEEEDDEDDDQMDEGDMGEPAQSAQPIVPNYEGFKAHVRSLNSEMDPKYNWLVSRVAHQQEIRYKNLLDMRVKHSQAILGHNCASETFCLSSNRHATVAISATRQRNNSIAHNNLAGLQLVTDFSDDSNPGEGALTDETFPQGVPMPPTRNLPDEFECQLCFKVKKFQKPSDWTKHVHEDVQPFTCTYERCKEPKSFKRKADWVRHENERHRHLEWWICQVEDCRHPCYRKDNFLQHLVREHKLPEPKQKTKAAIKKARLTEPAWVLLEQCHHETLKKPQEEPCKFCGKSFLTWKKLTVHLAKHMEHISLPILRLVEAKIVDANTIISPVENILTPIPVTPIGGPKMESSASPFDMNAISPHAPLINHFPTTGFEQPPYFQTAGQPTGYGMQASVSQGHFPVNDIYSNSFQPMNQSRGFQPLNANTLGHMQPRLFNNIHQTFQPKVEQQEFEPMDTGFSQMQNPHNFNSNHHISYVMAQPFSAAPPVSGFQAPNILGIDDGGYDFEPMPANSPQGYQQVPMNRGHGSSSSYSNEHSPQHNVPFYQ